MIIKCLPESAKTQKDYFFLQNLNVVMALTDFFFFFLNLHPDVLLFQGAYSPAAHSLFFNAP